MFSTPMRAGNTSYSDSIGSYLNNSIDFHSPSSNNFEAIESGETLKNKDNILLKLL
jgi:hypothetical protein